MPVWDDIIPENEREIMRRGGKGQTRVGFGSRPALLVVDMSFGFVDSSHPLGHSPTGWPTVKAIAEVLGVARAKGLPVFFTTGRWSPNQVERGLWKRTPAVLEALRDPRTYEIVAELGPRPDEPVVVKAMPSAFFGTTLASMLTMRGVDTIILTGMVTSGCIWATALDAFSHGYRVVIPEECVADRSQLVHKVCLWSFHMKYGDVIPVTEVLEHLRAMAPAGESR